MSLFDTTTKPRFLLFSLGRDAFVDFSAPLRVLRKDLNYTVSERLFIINTNELQNQMGVKYLIKRVLYRFSISITKLGRQIVSF